MEFNIRKSDSTKRIRLGTKFQAAGAWKLSSQRGKQKSAIILQGQLDWLFSFIFGDLYVPVHFEIKFLQSQDRNWK